MLIRCAKPTGNVSAGPRKDYVRQRLSRSGSEFAGGACGWGGREARGMWRDDTSLHDRHPPTPRNTPLTTNVASQTMSATDHAIQSSQSKGGVIDYLKADGPADVALEATEFVEPVDSGAAGVRAPGRRLHEWNTTRHRRLPETGGRVKPMGTPSWRPVERPGRAPGGEECTNRHSGPTDGLCHRPKPSRCRSKRHHSCSITQKPKRRKR